MQIRQLRPPAIQDLEQYWGRRVGIIVQQDDDEAERRRRRNREIDQSTAERLDLGRMALSRIWRAIQSDGGEASIDQSDQDAQALLRMGAVRLLIEAAPKAAERSARKRAKRHRWDNDLAAGGYSAQESARRQQRRERDTIVAEAARGGVETASWDISAIDLIAPSPWEVSNHVVDKPMIPGVEVQPVSEAGLRPARRMIMFGHQAMIGRQALLALTGTSQALGSSAKHMRMGVVSMGMVRVDLGRGPGGLAHAIVELQRMIGGAIKAELDRHGMELMFSAIEGPLWVRDGVLYCHLHAHLLLVQTRHLPPEAWMGYLAGMQRVSPRGYYRDAGQVRDLAEIVKYVSKGAVSPAEEREATSTGMVRTDIERLSPAQALAFSWSWHRRKRFRWFNRARQLQQDMDTQHAKWCREGTTEVDGERSIKVGATRKGTRDVAPTYNRKGEGSEDIILGTSIRAIMVDGVKRLVPCVRVMSPSAATMTTRLADLVERRGLQATADLAARLWQAGLAQHQVSGTSPANHPYEAHKTVNMAGRPSDQRQIGTLMIGTAAINGLGLAA